MSRPITPLERMAGTTGLEPATSALTAQHLGFRYVANEYEEADARADALAGNCQTVRRLERPALAMAMWAKRPQRRSSPRRLRKLFQTEQSGMPYSYQRFKP